MEKDMSCRINSDKIIHMYKRFSYRLNSDEKKIVDYFRSCGPKEQQLLLMICEPDSEEDELTLWIFRTG